MRCLCVLLKEPGDYTVNEKIKELLQQSTTTVIDVFGSTRYDVDYEKFAYFVQQYGYNEGYNDGYNEGFNAGCDSQ